MGSSFSSGVVLGTVLASFLGSIVGIVAQAASAQEPARDERVQIEVVAPTELWEGQSFEVALVVRYDAAFFERHALQFSRQRLDVPLRVDAAFFRELDGARRLDAKTSSSETAPNSDRISIVVEGQKVLAERIQIAPGGSAQDLKANERPNLHAAVHYVATRPGRLVLAAPTVSYTWSERFEEDFVGDRRPTERRVVTLTGAAREVVVRPLPTEGRPASFTGAVGSFEVSSDVGPVASDGSCPWTFEVRGQADLEAWKAPQLPTGHGVHVRGYRELREAGRYVVFAELVVTDPANARLPAIESSWFDPERGRYVVHRSEAQALGASAEATKPRAATSPTEGREADRDVGTPEVSAASDAWMRPRSVDLEDPARLESAFDSDSDSASTVARWKRSVLPLAPWLLALACAALAWLRRRRSDFLASPAAIATAIQESHEATEVEQLLGRYLQRLDPSLPSEGERERRARTLEACGIARSNAPRLAAALETTYRRRYAALAARETPKADSDDVEHLRALVRDFEAERRAEQHQARERGPVAIVLALLFVAALVFALDRALDRTTSPTSPRSSLPGQSAPTLDSATRLELARAYLATATALASIDDASSNSAPEAARAWQQVAAFVPGVRADALHNAGLSSFRGGHFADALLAFERAALAKPDDADLVAAQRACRARLGLASTPLASGSFVTRIFDDALSPRALLWVGLALQALGFCLLARRRLVAATALVILGSVSAMLSPLLVAETASKAASRALVTVARCDVRTAPSSRAARAFALGAGTTVHVAEASDRWARIESDHGRGWVRRTAIGVVADSAMPSSSSP